MESRPTLKGSLRLAVGEPGCREVLRHLTRNSVFQLDPDWIARGQADLPFGANDATAWQIGRMRRQEEEQRVVYYFELLEHRN